MISSAPIDDIHLRPCYYTTVRMIGMATPVFKYNVPRRRWSDGALLDLGFR